MYQFLRTEHWTHSTNFVLKDILLHKEIPTPFTKFLAAIGVKWLRQKIKENDLRRADPDYQNPFPHLDAMVHSDRFESAMGIIMLSNAIMIGFQVSAEGNESETAFLVLDFFFTFAFVIELFVRALPEGWRWWCKLSNIFDVIIVLATNVIPVPWLQSGYAEKPADYKYTIQSSKSIPAEYRMTSACKVNCFLLCHQVIWGVGLFAHGHRQCRCATVRCLATLSGRQIGPIDSKIPQTEDPVEPLPGLFVHKHCGFVRLQRN